jgi:hypothetical protein
MIVVMREYNIIEIESKILFPNYPTLIIKVGVLFLGCVMNMKEEQITKKISPHENTQESNCYCTPCNYYYYYYYCNRGN